MILNLNFETTTQQPFWQSPFWGIMLTAFFGWCFYTFKELVAYVKSCSENYFYIFNFIMKNHEACQTIWEGQTLVVLKEIDSFLETLDILEKLYDAEHGLITFKNKEEKEKYLSLWHRQMKSMESNLVLKNTYIQMFNFLIEKDIQKESLFMLLNGNFYFQKIILHLQEEYQRGNHNIEKINNLIQSRNSGKVVREFRFILNLEDIDLKEKINSKRQELLYFRSLYDSLNQMLEYSLFFGEIALTHLSDFNSLFAEKYVEIIRFLHIAPKFYKLEKQLVEIEDLQNISNKTKTMYDSYRDKGAYKHLKRTFWDGVVEFFFCPQYFFHKIKSKFIKEISNQTP